MIQTNILMAAIIKIKLMKILTHKKVKQNFLTAILILLVQELGDWV